ncbi:hypothetical protein LX32DRAFT_189241 [Colletotrichum zoysiae]|uniref:Zn(2)-C6 fungal-type domain-containing protein n=1 Tax=Colletotrichum zoysiae TaxID=1216348 RepID=A0AAD9M349_9PEZI|nr:hypothetical protein LX32DRAFT_189241 [Colletotrichum zoysiae]
MGPVSASDNTPVNDRRCYREIRPASEYNSSHVTGSCSQTGRKSNPEQKRRNVLVACESCRRRKTKDSLDPGTRTDTTRCQCSASRPKCSGCMAKNVECRYDADPSESRVASLKRRHDEIVSRNDSLEHFFAAMRLMPEAQAHHVFERIRSGASPDDIVREIEAGCLLVELALQGDVESARGEEELDVTEARRLVSRAKRIDVTHHGPVARSRISCSD